MGFDLTDTASDSANNSGNRSDSGKTETEELKLVTLEYTNKSDGNIIEEPVIELFCRDKKGRRRRIDVENYYPHFLVTEEEFVSKKDDLLSDGRVRKIEADERILSEEEKLNGTIRPVSEPPKETLDNRDLVKIYTVVPGNVADLRESFDEHFEADVFFTNRFLIDSGITLGLRVPKGASTVNFEDIESIDSDEVPDIDPRMLTVDIEVWSGGEFPDPENPQKPVTAITAHDSFTDRYMCGVLHPDSVSQGEDHSWPDIRRGGESPIDWKLPEGVDEDLCEVEVYHSEQQLLGSFIEFAKTVDPDLMTGWNSSRNEIGSGFDYPYIINRCERINVWSYTELPYENGGIFVTNRGTPSVGGREMFDMLQAYKKTQIHEKRSYSLGAIAEDELGYGKEDIEDLDEGWLHNPVEFMRYNIRDTEAVHKIEKEKSVLNIYDHVRSIAGATYSEIASANIGIIDMLFLRRANNKGYALPTSERPDTQHYWGAYVFDPQAGKHKNVVYPDLSSLYPNLFRDMNASPETIVGDSHDLQDSQYTEDDCHKVYVDPRPEAEKKAADEPERREMYVLKPEVQESFVREIVSELIDMKYEYKKDEYADEAYGAVKRIVNSVYGVMGDSVSYGKGFRLFDWRIAEAITLAGRDVIKHTADEFESRVQSMGYGNAEIIAGDSVPSDEPIIVKRDNNVSVIPIEEACIGDMVWSDNEFTEIKDVIKKPNRKKCYTVRTQTGITHTTSDHGLLYPDGTEITPTDVDEGENLMHRDVSDVRIDGSKNVSTELAWLLGVFCAEGSAGVYETNSDHDDYKAQVKVSNQDTNLLERAKEIFEDEYSFTMNINDDRESSNVYNLKPYYNERYDVLEMAARLKRMCYTSAGDKKVPNTIWKSNDKECRTAFLDGFHAGDGHIKKGNYEELKEYDEMWSKSKTLIQGIVVLLRDLDIDISLSYRRNHDSEYYRVRCPNFRKVDETECREIETYEYKGDYVYDLETENHHFASGIGSMVVHNTDSCVCEIPGADGSFDRGSLSKEDAKDVVSDNDMLDVSEESVDSALHETLLAAIDAAEYVDMTYDEFMTDRFWIEDDNMAVEIESYSESALFMDAKKRYAQWVRWDEGDYEDEIEVKGFELVRSDSARITGEVQKGVIDRILKNDSPEEAVSDYLQQEWHSVIEGDVDLDRLGTPSAINNPLFDYGWSIDEASNEDENDLVKYFTPQPHIRGARYSKAYVEGEDPSQGSKPLMFYTSGVTPNSGLPETYDYNEQYALNAPQNKEDANRREMKEIDREVDAIAVEDVRHLPEAINIDYEKMGTKTVRDPVEPITSVMGWSFDTLVDKGQQTGLGGYM